MRKNAAQFLRASRVMMESIDAAEGMSSRHLECFHFSFLQLNKKMVEDAKKRETREAIAERYPMGRKCWPKLAQGAEKPLEKPA